MPENPLIDTLREAVAVSPDNIPLRRHFAQTLLSSGYAADAEAEFRATIALAGNILDAAEDLQNGLLGALYRQGKSSEALLILQEIKDSGAAPLSPTLMAQRARLLADTGQIPLAIGEYLQAIDADPSVADPELSAALGLASNAPPAPDAERPPPAPTPPQSTASDLQEGVTPISDLNFSQTETGDEWEGEGAGEGEDVSVADDVEAWIRLGADGERIDVEASADDYDDDDDESEGEELERPKINFTDVGGMQQVKEEIDIKIIQPLLHPELYEAYGKSAGGGILMYGPPGCGKTHLARATAGEVRAQFISVGINDVLDMYFGNSEQKLHELFNLARSHTPCVLFFDEVDALGASRTDMRQSTGRHLINQFLSELDGVNTSNDGVLILAATNAPWHLDSAFRRPGRFDRIVFVPPPDDVARGEILRILLHGKPIEKMDFDKLGKKLKDLSGADLKAVVDTAIEAKLREAMQKGKPSPLTTRDMQQAAKRIKPTTKEWFQSARNYALYSNESGLYDDILEYLNIKR